MQTSLQHNLSSAKEHPFAEPFALEHEQVGWFESTQWLREGKPRMGMDPQGLGGPGRFRIAMLTPLCQTGIGRRFAILTFELGDTK